MVRSDNSLIGNKNENIPRNRSLSLSVSISILNSTVMGLYSIVLLISYFKNGILWEWHGSLFCSFFMDLSGQVCGKVMLWERSSCDGLIRQLGKGQDRAEQTRETWASLQNQQHSPDYSKRPPESAIKSIIRCSPHPLEFIFISQTDLTIDQQLPGQQIHLWSNQGKAQ